MMTAYSRTLLLITSLFLLVGCSEIVSSKIVDYDKTVERNGLRYEVNSETPFTGQVIRYHKNGQKKKEGTFKDGKEDGKQTLWYENGQMWYEEIYKDGEVIADKYWDEDGNPTADNKFVVVEEHNTVFRSGLLYEVNKEIPFTGKVVVYYKNGQMKGEGTAKDGRPDGKFTSWYENGQKETEGTWKNNQLDGKQTRWYENGQIEGEDTYKDGKLDGNYTSWYENGQKETEGTKKNYQLDGKQTSWYENGQKEHECTWKGGKRDGKQTRWYENGQIEGEDTYKDGKLITKKEWDEDGNPK